MNIKHYLSAAAALAMFAACSDYDPGMSENAVDLTDAEIESATMAIMMVVEMIVPYP